MRENFDTAFEKVIGHEGKFQADPQDRGNWTTGQIGKGQLKGTKYGVSAMSYPNLDIKNLTLGQAKDIYKGDFWDKLRADELPSGVDYVMFDMAINHGSKNAVRIAQRALGVTDDGILGAQTFGAFLTRDPVKLIKEMGVRRGLFYTGIGTFSRYGLGWFRRLVDVTVDAIDIARNYNASWTDPKQSDRNRQSVLGGLFRKV